MRQERSSHTARRRKRVEKFKKIIIRFILLIILIPSVCCAVLFYRLNGFEDGLKTADAQIAELKQTIDLLNDKIGDLQASVSYNEAFGGKSADDVKRVEDDLNISDGLSDELSEYEHIVYLTFDDGPSKYTDEILDILDAYGVKATFFVVGKEDEVSKNAIKRIVDDGHTLGMHSYSHVYTDLYKSMDSFSGDFYKLQDYLYDLTGVRSEYYRFPGGSSNTVSSINMQEAADFLANEGVTFFDWNVAPEDMTGKSKSASKLADNCLKKVAGWKTSVILLHDSADKYTTVKALSLIIDGIQDMDNTVILPITGDTVPVQHIHMTDTD